MKKQKVNKSLLQRLVHKVICFREFKNNPLTDLDTNKIVYAKIWYVLGFNVKVEYIELK